MILKGIEIDRGNIKGYLIHDVLKYIEFFLNYKIFGFPYLAGWAEQPCHVLDIIKMLEIEERKWQMT